MKLAEVPRTALEIGLGAGDLLFHRLVLRLNPFACGTTVLGTGKVKRTGDIIIHDHDVRYPNKKTIVKGDEQNPVASYTEPQQGLIIEPYDLDKHGAIDWPTWKKEGNPGTGGINHQHLTGGACLP